MNVKVLCCLYFLLRFSKGQSYEQTVDYYVHMVEEGIRDALNYTLPTDASQYKPKQSEIKEFGHFDFIIIGSGAAGSVIASRLSEIKGWKILLLEAGTFENNFTNVPALYYYDRGSKYNWAFTSSPQTTCCLGMVDRKCAYPRGKAFGGSTVLNGLIYSRGNRIDYDRWASEGNPEWAYKYVLPYFIRQENSKIHGDVGYHGTGGPLDVQYHNRSSAQLNAFFEANQELGIPIVDYNGARQQGVSRIQSNIRNGKRLSASRAFLKPALSRNNLRVNPESYVTKILINNGTAHGVVFTNGGTTYVARAKKEVILSGGVINSPQILMLSGVGPSDHLQELGINTVKNLPVGNNLQDHPTFYGMYFQTNYSDPGKTVREYVEEFLNETGLYTVAANLQGIGYYQTYLNKEVGYPDLELVMAPSPILNAYTQTAFRFTDETYDGLWRHTDGSNSFIIYVVLLRPRSKGTIRLESSDAFRYPIIDSQFLSDSEGMDIEKLRAGAQIVMKLAKTDAFKKMNAKLGPVVIPACRNLQHDSKEYWHCNIRHLTTNLYHPVGTCKMGANSRDSVVDSRLKVHGVKALRVADASVLPFSIAGHPAAGTMMLADRTSDFIIEEHGKQS